MSSSNTTKEHVGALLSGYIDGELTQQQAQRVRLHCDSCAKCAEELEQLESLRREVGKTRLSPLGEDIWREHMKEPTVELTRGIGWILFILGVLGISGIAIWPIRSVFWSTYSVSCSRSQSSALITMKSSPALRVTFIGA